MVGLLGVAGVAAVWLGSEALLRPLEFSEGYPLQVQAVSSDSITLSRHSGSLLRGTYSLEWLGGHGLLGPIQRETSLGVTRRFRSSGGQLERGEKVRVSTSVRADNPRSTYGLKYQTVQVPAELGALPSWQVWVTGRVTSSSTSWVVMAHGRAGGPQEAIHLTGALHRMGWNVLVMRYRNDPDAPRSTDGLYHLGDTEWRDLEAGVRYVLERRAQRVVLYGISTGGNLAATLLVRSTLRGKINALVLDAPALSWRSILDRRARALHLPTWTVTPVVWLAERRAQLDLERIEYTRVQSLPRLPTLIFHGQDDQIVPLESSQRFADIHPWTEFHAVANAMHLQAWNVNPNAYEATLERFLVRLPSAEVLPSKRLSAP